MRDSVEPAALWIVRARFVPCDNPPLVPCTETVKFPVAALAAAPIRRGTAAPAATVNGLRGLDVTPAGSALRVTCTEPLKPFNAFTEILIAELVAPCKMDTEDVEKPSEKSAAGGGGGWVKDEEPPPQPAHPNVRRRTIIGTP